MPPAAPTPLKFAVSIDGIVVSAQNAVGGLVKADVSTMFSGAGGPPKRQISSFGYTNLRFQLGAGCRYSDTELGQCCVEGRPHHQERNAHRARRPESRQV